MDKICHYLDRFSQLIGHAVAPLTFAMMGLTCVVVISRYSFNLGLTSVVEAVIYLHGMVFLLGIPWTLKEQAHVRVDIFYTKFSNRRKAVVDLLGTILFLFPISIFLIWASWDYVALSWRFQEGSAEPGGLPFVYLLKTLIPVMAVLLVIQGISEFLRALNSIRHSIRHPIRTGSLSHD